jgi:hypothetical protein
MTDVKNMDAVARLPEGHMERIEAFSRSIEPFAKELSNIFGGPDEFAGARFELATHIFTLHRRAPEGMYAALTAGPEGPSAKSVRMLLQATAMTMKREDRDDRGWLAEMPSLAAIQGLITLSDPSVYMASWRSELHGAMPFAVEAARTLDSILAQNPSGQPDDPLTAAEARAAASAVKPFVRRYLSSLQFYCLMNNPLMGRFESAIAMSECAHVGNNMYYALALGDHSFERYPTREFLKEGSSQLRNLSDPFQVLEKVYVIEPRLKGRLDVQPLADLPRSAPPMGIEPRFLVSRVLDAAGLTAQERDAVAKIEARWDPAENELSFADVTDGIEAFAAFQPGMPGHAELEGHAARAGAGWSVKVLPGLSAMGALKAAGIVSIGLPRAAISIAPPPIAL